jgi:phosphoadenosine phosphosulfate reductase
MGNQAACIDRSTEGLELSIEEAAERLEGAHPREILSWAFEAFAGRIAIATGFGLEGMAIVDMATRLVRKPDVFFVDTSFLFPETYQLRRRVEARYGLEIRAVETPLTPAMQEDAYGERLWERDPDLCCWLRKVEPLRGTLDGLAAWVTGVRRGQSKTRALARAVEWDSRWGLVKINPLVWWSGADVRDYVKEFNVPYNPLHDSGYPSVGCTHCTRSVAPGEDERAGRWSGFGKTECGLHADR